MNICLILLLRVLSGIFINVQSFRSGFLLLLSVVEFISVMSNLFIFKYLQNFLAR